MSWDVFVQDLPAEVRDVSEIPDDFRPRPLGRRSDIAAQIRGALPGARFPDPSWGSVEGPGYSIEFNLGHAEVVTSFALHVRGGDLAPGAVADLLSRCGWRALDATSESGLFDPATAADSLARWRSHRDRVLGTRGGR